MIGREGGLGGRSFFGFLKKKAKRKSVEKKNRRAKMKQL